MDYQSLTPDFIRAVTARSLPFVTHMMQNHEEMHRSSLRRYDILDREMNSQELVIINSARQTGSTECLLKHVLYLSEVNKNETYVVVTKYNAYAKELLLRMQFYIQDLIAQSEYTSSGRVLTNQRSGSKIVFSGCEPSGLRGYSISGLFFDCFISLDEYQQKDIMAAVAPIVYSCGGRTVMMNSGRPQTVSPYYTRLQQNAMVYNVPYWVDDATFETHQRLINTYGKDTYMREYLCK